MLFLEVAAISQQLNGNQVLDKVSFSQEQFQKIAIAGETGSGKTSLMEIIAGLQQPAAGEVWLEGKKVPGPDEQLIAGHKRIRYVSQHFQLRNNYRVEEELEYTNSLSDVEAAAIFEICRIGHLLKRWTNELSGGEKQRIVTARALIASPHLLLLDEPFSNLDMQHKSVMKLLLHDITEKLKISCILVSHDPLDVLSWAQQILVLQQGKIIQQGTPSQVYLQPATEYVASLFGNYNLLTPTLKRLFPLLETPGNQQIIIRPEFFIIQKNTASPNATVQKLAFFGSYLEAAVLMDGLQLIIQIPACEIQIGDRISVTLREDWQASYS